ncbi:MAG: sugar ABC transporter permease [Caldilineaceae bacterium]|nr:sugar ABC transporter permease [Caldilineaceae bacterium]MCB0143481.1 sugar ABC transporter permease [Caldilineaceae bacterium]
MSTLTADSRRAVDVGAAPSLQERWQRFTGSETFTAYLFLIVPLLILFAIKIYPVFYNVFLSFTNYDLFSPLEFVGLKNYRDVFGAEVNIKAIRNTILFAVGAVPIGTTLALVVAGLLNQPIRGRILFRFLFYLPVITSVVVSAMIWRYIYSPQFGLLNYAIGFFGIPPQQWLNDPSLAMPSLIIITIWGALGGHMIIFLAALQDVPNELREAAAIDGAKGWQTYLYVVVPLLRPVILFVVVTYTIGIFRNFGLIFLLTQGGPQNTTNTLVWEVYQNAFGYLRFGRAAALAMVLLFTILVITALNFRLLREENT